MKKPVYSTPFPAALCYAFSGLSFLGFLAAVLMSLKGDAGPLLAAGSAMGALIWLAIGQLVERPYKKDHAELLARWSSAPLRGRFINASLQRRDP